MSKEKKIDKSGRYKLTKADIMALVIMFVVFWFLTILIIRYYPI